MSLVPTCVRVAVYQGASKVGVIQIDADILEFSRPKHTIGGCLGAFRA